MQIIFIGAFEKNCESNPREVNKNKRKKNSAVWKYFKRSSDRKLAKCLTCQKEYRTSGNTSNLSDHLKRFHPSLDRYDYNEYESTAHNETESSSSVTSATASFSVRSSMSISPYFKRAVFYDSSSQRKKDLDKALLEMIVLDMQPFSIVKDRGFRKFISLLDPRYELPSAYTLCHKMLEESYTEVCTQLKIELSQIEYVAITFDAWTSVATESYVTVTCHFVDKDFCLKSAVLSTKPLPEVNHTAHNLSEALKAIFSEWEINEKITCIVSDNANNMISTCNLLQKRHMPCFAHSLNLVVQDCLPGVSGILKRVKIIVTYFKSSYVAMDTFKKEQNTKEPLKLLQEVPTRWNSSFYMIERVIKTNEALNRSLLQLRSAPAPLSLEELTILYDIQKVLSCFEEATKKIQGCLIENNFYIEYNFFFFRKYLCDYFLGDSVNLWNI